MCNSSFVGHPVLKQNFNNYVQGIANPVLFAHPVYVCI